MIGTEVFLSLGSNLGDRRASLAGGLAELERCGVRVTARSSVYETEPVGVDDQPCFLNQVIRGRTRLSPPELLDQCQRIEDAFGRDRHGIRFGPRSLDIDILLFGEQRQEDERLTLPHPRMHERRFVLVPLVEIAPDLVDPRTGTRYGKLLERLDEGKKVSPSLPNES